MFRFLAFSVKFLMLTKFVSPTECVVRDVAFLQAMLKASDAPRFVKTRFRIPYIRIQIRILIRDDFSPVKVYFRAQII